MTKLTQAFGSMRGGGADNTQQLTQAISSMAPGGGGSSTYATRFATDLGKIMPTVTMAAPAQQQLATAIAYAMSPGAQPAQLGQVLMQVRQTLVDSGASPIAAQSVAYDLHLAAAEAHPNILEGKAGSPGANRSK